MQSMGNSHGSARNATPEADVPEPQAKLAGVSEASVSAFAPDVPSAIQVVLR